MKSKTAKELYLQLREEYCEEELQRLIGGYRGFKKYVYDEGGVSEFYKWLDTPTPDWQCDC